MAALSRSFRVYHKLEPPYSVILENRNMDDTLMFESNAVAILSSAETETIRKQYNKILDAYGCLGVLNLNIGEEHALYLVMVTGCLSVGKIGDSELFCITATQFISMQNLPGDDERIVGVRNLFNSRTFYFAWSASGVPWDLTLCAQRKHQEHQTDNRFFWNRSLHVHFHRYGIETSTWLLRTICGGVEIRTVYAAHRQAKACLIARLSCERAGTRFNVRGTNDDGHVANFVETEQVIFLDDQISSFVQTRGSVPLFWEQPGIQVGSHKVKMSRGYEASAPAFDRHVSMLKQQYGDQVMVNLLGVKEGEHMLSQAFQNHHKASVHVQDVPLINFDYHSECRGGNLKNLEKLKSQLLKYINSFDFFCGEKEEMKRYQTGTVRTNCLDCLDRTNSVQSLLGLQILPQQLESLDLTGKAQMVSRFTEIYKQIWTQIGDHVSRIYAGTGALGGGRSKASDAARSATRTIQNNFLDNSKQEAIDILLLGSTLRGELADKARALLTIRKMHASPSILHQMVSRYKAYTSTSPLRIMVGTWNVNGGKHFRSIAFKHQSMTDWLLDAPKILKDANPDYFNDEEDFNTPVDIFAVGFEEIVDLNASNIMSASTTNAREWEKYIQKTISRDHKYIVLTRVQLVGVILYVFIRPHLAPLIRDVAIDSVKTGLGGAAGNKGGVGIRFLVRSTSICFVCAHLAAGHSQVSDRNNDYNEISKKMAFPMGRTISSHDYVFWCGDFNYRIDLPGDEVKELVKNENWSALQACDQLNVERESEKSEKVFIGFIEGKTNFAPTYKYDLFCDDYDTSDKCRIPAWTDRILWKANPFIRYKKAEEPEILEAKQLFYTRSELKTSDHRPVVAEFDIRILEVNESEKERIFDEVLSQQGPQDGTVIISVDDGEFDDDVIDEIIGKFSDVGEIILVRFVREDMWLIFKSGQCAIQALQYDSTQIQNKTIHVRLKSYDWKTQIENELKLCSLNAAPLFNNITNSLLGEDFDIPSMDYDSEGDVEEEELSAHSKPLSGANTPSGSGRNSPAVSDVGLLDQSPITIPSKPAPPCRPAGVPVSGQVSDRSTTTSGSLIVPQQAPRLRGKPANQPEKLATPQRPMGPPAKPPPPKRPPGGPPKQAALSGSTLKPAEPDETQSASPRGSPISGRPAPAIKQPLGPKDISKIKSKQQNKVTMIGLPTNVKHHSHASTPEEAQKMIENLMSRIDNSLPPPIMPAGSSQGGKPAPLPRSRTSNDMNASQDDSATLTPAKAIPRFHSMENLSSADMTSPSRPPRRKDTSPPSTDSGSMPQLHPQPAPRRDIQSCVVTPALNKGPWLGPPPPVPQARPQSSIISSSKVSDNIGLDSNNKFKSGSTAEAPAVPLRKLGDASHLLDAPLSPGHTEVGERDPFDTSNIPTNFLSQSENKPVQYSNTVNKVTAENNVNRDRNVSKSEQQSVHPAVPPRPRPPVVVQESEIVINDDDGLYENRPPEFSPPPTPPELECPTEPPPPPPRNDSSPELFPSSIGSTNDTTPQFPGRDVGRPPPPVPSRPPVAHDTDWHSQEPAVPVRPVSHDTHLTNQHPPLPSRPAVSHDVNLTNQESESKVVPPIPSRPSYVPPVPPRSQ